MKQRSVKKNSRGFTLVEIMVSISIFAIIITTGMGALLQITRSYQISQNRSAVIANLQFAIESMVRDIRLGDNYYAGNFGSLPSFDDQDRHNDSSGVTGNTQIVFKGAPGRGVIRYTFDTSSSADDFLVREQHLSGTTSTASMVSDVGGIVITDAVFRVVGSSPDDDLQPSVFIYIRGEDTENQIPFVIQTLVSQRNLDI